MVSVYKFFPPFIMRLIPIFIEFFILTAVVFTVVCNPWSWRFLPSSLCYYGGSGWLTPLPPCHRGGKGRLPPLIQGIMWELPVWVVVSYGEGGALGMWRLLLAFFVKSLIWIIWVGKLGRLAIGPMLHNIGP
jgi:hypothetical protein